ncbi:MAG: endonuclease Q family protein [Candidatus Woesearchaeota archaeon]|nr:endonuclease Q family protein [Candidatus Woesearchaeota archaeon]MDP7182066.1 endonuclease Q family protein [Candidatus Woesearchaeota archaeon]MDP7198668.1 endonuclease Q family protein [Candidatus Woesearchaeota archaeon]MDP7467642.1 endonuclease Q family protein [Candidatus Woesearchaeota archaeon]MDP7647140.1 endonuclease Q family protein [Candidatus Woesearchaeota archaeon]
MHVISDLHIHSRFSRATSKYITLKNLAKYGAMKGIQLLGTGDFQHPEWYEEIKAELQEDGGIYKAHGMHFMLTTEISLIYTDKGKGRRVHVVVWSPTLAVAKQVQDQCLKWGRIDYDGRPIFKVSCAQFVESMKSISKDIEVIPAHVWTPWFSMFGSMSGYDSFKDCFEDQSKNVHAIETGLSSDPEMNWRFPELDNKTILSFSDAHSHWPWKLGREATVFDVKKLTYDDVIRAVRDNHVVKTIEFFPEEGKYHFDGHRKCDVCMHPAESIKINNLCPKCGKQMTIGVAHRVEDLATREKGQGKPYIKLIPLAELIAAYHGNGLQTKKVQEVYAQCIKKFGNEFKILLDTPQETLERFDKGLARLIVATREQKIPFKPGYDGVFGEPQIEGWECKPSAEEQTPVKPSQKGLSEF